MCVLETGSHMNKSYSTCSMRSRTRRGRDLHQQQDADVFSYPCKVRSSAKFDTNTLTGITCVSHFVLLFPSAFYRSTAFFPPAVATMHSNINTLLTTVALRSLFPPLGAVTNLVVKGGHELASFITKKELTS